MPGAPDCDKYSASGVPHANQSPDGKGYWTVQAPDDPAPSSRDDLAYLQWVGEQPDDAINLAETALRLGALGFAGCDLAPYRAHLEAVCTAVTQRRSDDDGARLGDRIKVLRQILVDEFGYSGDRETYDDLDNANLLRVIDRRRGLPVALGILFLHVARSQNWPAAGLSFPGHFLIRLDGNGKRAIIDPFGGGRVLATDELRTLLKKVAGPDAELEPHHYAGISNRSVLLRLQNNVKIRRIKNGDLVGGLRILQTMQRMAPTEPSLWHERGLLQTQLGELGGAITAFEQFQTMTANPVARDRIGDLIQHLRAHLH